MSVDVVIEDPRWVALGLEALAERAFHSTLDHLGLDPESWECCVMACDDARIADLNADFRDKPTPTNVLSWPSEEHGAEVDGVRPELPAGPDPELGDIAIAYDTCARESEAAGKPMQDHVTHLLVHGVLHLLGFDHIRDQDAALMEGLEVEILGKLGLNNPY